MPAEGTPRRRWLAPVVYGVLGLELAVVIVFAAAYNALDFRIYMWGGHAVLDDSRLYLALAYGHWFTYSPFAATVFVPVKTLPLAMARVLWDLARSRRWPILHPHPADRRIGRRDQWRASWRPRCRWTRCGRRCSSARST